MCPVSALPLQGPTKGASCQAPALIVLYQTAWMGWLILGCIAAPTKQSSSLLGRSENSVSASGPRAAVYAHTEQHDPHRSSPPISLYRSPTSLKGGHGKCQNVQVDFSALCSSLLRCVSVLSTCMKQRKREWNMCMYYSVMNELLRHMHELVGELKT